MNVGWFALAFKVLMAVPVRWREIWPGAVLAAVGWQVLLLAGGLLVNRSLRGATQSYGFFGIVLGLLAWIALLANLLVLAAEVNAVRHHRLWPRSLLTPALTPSDRRALTGYGAGRGAGAERAHRCGVPRNPNERRDGPNRCVTTPNSRRAPPPDAELIGRSPEAHGGDWASGLLGIRCGAAAQV